MLMKAAIFNVFLIMKTFTTTLLLTHPWSPLESQYYQTINSLSDKENFLCHVYFLLLVE